MGVKRPGREADYSLATSAEVRMSGVVSDSRRPHALQYTPNRDEIQFGSRKNKCL
jgi:hypothetical protein